MWDKNFLTEKRDTTSLLPLLPPPLLSINFFDTRNFVKHRRVPLWNFSALWDKKFSTENLDTPSPLLSKNFFATGHFLKHRSEGFLYEIFRHCETKNFWQRIVILPSPLIHKFFRHQKLCETKKGSPTKFFGTVREQIFHTKSWSSPHRHKRFRYQKFSETQTGPRRNFSALWDKKNSTKNRDITLWSIKSFDTRN